MGKLFRGNEAEQHMAFRTAEMCSKGFFFRWRKEQSIHQGKILRTGSGYAAQISREFEDSPTSAFTLLGELAAKFSRFEVLLF